MRDVWAPSGKALKEGDIVFQRELGNTLERISLYGADEFYRGSIASQLVQDVQSAGGILSLQDLIDYKPIVCLLSLLFLTF